MTVLIDTGPLVAFLSEGDAHHDWATKQWQLARPPMVTCDAVIAEAVFLLQRERRPTEGIFKLVERGVIQLDFSLGAEAEAIAVLVERYSKVPMSLADACLVRMSETHSDARVFTLDRDFLVYRRQRRQVIPLIAPW
jgi:predicted nucleic acid-binding protein